MKELQPDMENISNPMEKMSKRHREVFVNKESQITKK